MRVARRQEVSGRYHAFAVRYIELHFAPNSYGMNGEELGRNVFYLHSTHLKEETEEPLTIEPLVKRAT